MALSFIITNKCDYIFWNKDYIQMFSTGWLGWSLLALPWKSNWKIYHVGLIKIPPFSIVHILRDQKAIAFKKFLKSPVFIHFVSQVYQSVYFHKASFHISCLGCRWSIWLLSYKKISLSSSFFYLSRALFPHILPSSSTNFRIKSSISWIIRGILCIWF